jgi:hypothetical protein
MSPCSARRYSGLAVRPLAPAIFFWNRKVWSSGFWPVPAPGLKIWWKRA